MVQAKAVSARSAAVAKPCPRARRDGVPGVGPAVPELGQPQPDAADGAPGGRVGDGEREPGPFGQPPALTVDVGLRLPVAGVRRQGAD